MTELKPCPFCGSSPFEYKMLSEYGGFIVECEGCACRTSTHEDRLAAKETWNTRDAWVERAIRNHEKEHGPCGDAWNISSILNLLARIETDRPRRETGLVPKG